MEPGSRAVPQEIVTNAFLEALMDLFRGR